MSVANDDRTTSLGVSLPRKGGGRIQLAWQPVILPSGRSFLEGPAGGETWSFDSLQALEGSAAEILWNAGFVGAPTHYIGQTPDDVWWNAPDFRREVCSDTAVSEGVTLVSGAPPRPADLPLKLLSDAGGERGVLYTAMAVKGCLARLPTDDAGALNFSDAHAVRVGMALGSILERAASTGESNTRGDRT